MDFAFYLLEKSVLILANFIHKLRLSSRKPAFAFKKAVKLDLGSGGRKKKGFIGIDATIGPGVDIEHNLEGGIPLADASVSEIYSSHLLEHLSHAKVPKMLAEINRVLMPGGKVVIEVPDLEENLRLFLKMKEGRKWQEGWQAIFGNQRKEFEFHKTGFTKKRLSGLLKVAGFKNIAVTRYKFGSIPSLRARAAKPLL